MLDEVREALRCPVCTGALNTGAHAHATGALTTAAPTTGALNTGAHATGPAGLRCESGHTFDVARQGYVNLLTGPAPAGAETPAMVAARESLFAAGHLDPLTAAIVAQVPTDAGLVLDVGAGTGHHLAAVLAARPGSVGVALDVSKAAARRSARAHPAMASVVADVWRRLPLGDGCAGVVLDVFAPRNGAEFHRVLRPTGTLVVVTPAADHLAELVGPLGLLTVDPAKPDRVQASLGRWFEPVRRDPCRYGLALTRDDAARFVGMGPCAWHIAPDELARRLADWPEPVTVTLSVEVAAYRPVATYRG